MTNREKKEIELMLRNIPVSDYEEILRIFGFCKEDQDIMALRYRDSLGYKATREEVAEESGLSVSTLDRRLINICRRIGKYAADCFSNYKSYIPNGTYINIID